MVDDLTAPQRSQHHMKKSQKYRRKVEQDEIRFQRITFKLVAWLCFFFYVLYNATCILIRYLYCHSSSHVIPVVAFHIFSWSSRNLSEHRYDFCTQEFNDALELQLLLLHAKAPKPWWGSAARFTFAGVKHGRWQAQASQTLRTGKTSYTTTWRHGTAIGGWFGWFGCDLGKSAKSSTPEFRTNNSHCLWPTISPPTSNRLGCSLGFHFGDVPHFEAFQNWNLWYWYWYEYICLPWKKR